MSAATAAQLDGREADTVLATAGADAAEAQLAAIDAQQGVCVCGF